MSTSNSKKLNPKLKAFLLDGFVFALIVTILLPIMGMTTEGTPSYVILCNSIKVSYAAGIAMRLFEGTLKELFPLFVEK